MEQINIFWGSDEKFNNSVQSLKDSYSITDVFNHINKTEIEINGLPPVIKEPLKIDHLIINTDDYGAIKEWALIGFSNNILKNNKLMIHNLWLNNPPIKFYRDIIRGYSGIVIEEQLEYSSISLDDLRLIVRDYENCVIGQKDVIKQIASALYLLNNKQRRQPVSILFLGDSGVGKTETAKYLSSCLQQDMVRVQFSMQQIADAYKFIFGADHGEDSLARELVRRTSNLVLLDEFDKVHPSFYNAFYQMFDEGIFVDSNYMVNMEKCVIICTSNYRNEEDAEKHLGTPIYSRFSKIIKFDDISIEDRTLIAKIIYDSLMEKREKEEQKILEGNVILSTFTRAISLGAYKNIRMLKNDIEDAINFEILKGLDII